MVCLKFSYKEASTQQASAAQNQELLSLSEAPSSHREFPQEIFIIIILKPARALNLKSAWQEVDVTGMR